MKLNKITFQWLIYHALHSDAAGHVELKIIEEIEKALSEDTLEIEGYSCNEWVKFDPDDPKTFPQRDEEEVLLYVTCHNRENIEKFIIQATVNWISHNECYFSDFNGDEVHDNVDDITHWSPLPKPPIEEKAK